MGTILNSPLRGPSAGAVARGPGSIFSSRSSAPTGKDVTTVGGRLSRLRGDLSGAAINATSVSVRLGVSDLGGRVTNTRS